MPVTSTRCFWSTIDWHHHSTSSMMQQCQLVVHFKLSFLINNLEMLTTLDAISWHHHDNAADIPESSPLSYSWKFFTSWSHQMPTRMLSPSSYTWNCFLYIINNLALSWHIKSIFVSGCGRGLWLQHGSCGSPPLTSRRCVRHHHCHVWQQSTCGATTSPHLQQSTCRVPTPLALRGSKIKTTINLGLHGKKIIKSIFPLPRRTRKNYKKYFCLWMWTSPCIRKCVWHHLWHCHCHEQMVTSPRTL